MSSLPADRLELVYPAGPPPWDTAPDCAAIVVGGRYTKRAAATYAGTGIQIVTLIDWPTGLGKPTVRQIAAVAAIKDGSHAVEIAACPEAIRAADFEALRDDLYGVVSAVREVTRAAGVRVALGAPAGDDAATKRSDLLRAMMASGTDTAVFAGPVAEVAAWAQACDGFASLRCVARVGAEDAPAVLAAGADRVGLIREPAG